MSKKSGKSGGKAPSKGSRTSSPEKLLDGDSRVMDETLNDRDEFGINPEGAFNMDEDEDEKEAERMRLEAKAKGLDEGTKFPEFFVDGETG